MSDVVLNDEWKDLRGTLKDDHREFVRQTIVREAPPDDVVVQSGFSVVAKHIRLEYHVAALDDGRLALIHLTYRMSKSPDPLYCAEVFDSFDALNRRAHEWARGE